MNPQELDKFLQEVIIASNVREILKKRVSQIDKLESLDDLKDLRLTELTHSGAICVLYYEATASRNLYPHVQAKLIEKGVISKHNALRHELKNKGQADEYETVWFGMSSNSIQVSLKAYNPEYKIPVPSPIKFK